MAWEARSGLCAMSRIRVSLVQPGGTGRTVPGSSTLPGSESSGGKQHSEKAIIIRQMIGKRDGKTRAIGVKLDCLKFPNHQRLKTGLTGKHLKPVPISARVINPDRGNLPRCGR